MTEQITYARLNIISGEAFFEQFAPGFHPAANAFWHQAEYGEILRKLGGGAGFPGFEMPWRDGQRSTFWKSYCEQTPIGQISAEQAARMMIPLRLVATVRPTVRIGNGGERLFYDINAFPYGLVASLTIQTGSGTILSLDQWRDRMRELQTGPCYSLEVPGAAAEHDLRAPELLDRLVGWHRQTYYGPITAATASERPFSIATVIQGTGVDTTVPLASRPDLQKILNAVAALPVNWQAAALPPLDNAVLSTSGQNASPADALYATRRGRVLWRPALFTYTTSASARLHSLSCLAHNLLSASIQAESLRLFAIRYAALPPAERDVIPPLQRLRAATLIGRLWRGDQTYRSASVRRLLEDSGSLAQVNLLLATEQVAAIG